RQPNQEHAQNDDSPTRNLGARKSASSCPASSLSRYRNTWTLYSEHELFSTSDEGTVGRASTTDRFWTHFEDHGTTGNIPGLLSCSTKEFKVKAPRLQGFFGPIRYPRADQTVRKMRTALTLSPVGTTDVPMCLELLLTLRIA